MSAYKNILFVDYENVSKVDLNTIPADVQVPFFFGASQKSVPTDFMKAALKLGQRFLPIDIEGQGTNALDFHIAFYLGEYLAADVHANCIILSKDKGFDPLVKHLRGRGFKVRRATTISEAFPSAVPAKSAASRPTAAQAKTAEDTPWTSVLTCLEAMQKSTRPKKRKALVAYLYTHFGKKISEFELGKLVDRMIADKKVTEVSGALVYTL